MYFHIITSIDCNSECRYCYKKSCDDFGNDLNKTFKFDFSMPARIKYSIEQLKQFLARSKTRHTLTFYGGEPLMDIEKIKEIMDNVDARYMMQTNGKLLDKLPKEYINRFELMLISIDGDKKLTDFNRGEGTYDKVISNISLIRKNGFKGELIARMVVDEHSNVFESVNHLFSTGFDAVHWQLDAGFYQQDFKQRNFKEFSKKYNSEVSGLLDYWLNEMKKGKVLKIYPFLGIFESLYYSKTEKLRCGSGFANYTIAPDGKISVCPIMHDATVFQVGDILKDNPDNLKQIFVEEPCTSCDIYGLCGGRCLYANKASLWPKEGQDLICFTVRHLIDAIRTKLPEIRALISEGKITETQFSYEKYTGPEIIP
ncbi:MAG: TIGR04084 family radical SAM/SPASM domain-containing protein [Candidatus Nanoarchaeia archaeon]|nr:TIGR04084 family radical SAM/SPASM domain-containing protein [Candidatus Nanoarchaeia archaeon]